MEDFETQIYEMIRNLPASDRAAIYAVAMQMGMTQEMLAEAMQHTEENG